MKKIATSFAIATILVFGLSLTALAQGHDKAKKDHSTMGKAAAGHEMDHSGHLGEMIHESTVDGHSLAYHLIDMKEQMKGMKGMKDMAGAKEMKMTHHLMVYVMDPNGKELGKAKTGYMVTNPDGKKQKMMAMGMKGGFGADVNLSAKGAYTVKTKITAGDTKLKDKFTYEVK